MKEESDETIIFFNDFINRENSKELIKETFGVAILKNGNIIKIFNNFELIIEIWKLYKIAKVLDDKTMLKKVLTENTDGGLIDSGLSVFDITEIDYMNPLYRHFIDSEEIQLKNVNKIRKIDEFLYGLENSEIIDEDENLE